VLPGFVTAENAPLIQAGLVGRGGSDDGFTNSPRRAAILRWFSWRRNGFATAPGVTVLRKGAIWRELIIVPQARIQSIALYQGPLLRRVGVAAVRVHTVAGPVYASLGAVDSAQAVRFFEETADAAVFSAGTDTSHRWRSSAVPVPAAVAPESPLEPAATTAQPPESP
jgi:putative membrane protein